MTYQIPLRGHRNKEKGSSFVEVAILMPVMILMCCGAMDFARVVYAGISIASAARAGVQFGALTPGNSGNTDGMALAAKTDATDLGVANVTATASNFCICSGGTSHVACSSCTGTVTPNGYVAVTASYTFNTLMTWPGIPQAVQLSRTAEMRVQ